MDFTIAIVAETDDVIHQRLNALRQRWGNQDFEVKLHDTKREIYIKNFQGNLAQTVLDQMRDVAQGHA